MRNGGPAFPCISPDPEMDQYNEWGMSLRDYFAARAAIYVPEECGDTWIAMLVGTPKPHPQDLRAVLEWYAKAEAIQRYIKADAMLAERNK